ncbi:PIN domain-containing protein [bacterium]|nr:PIN domain-containing protein [bacterium]
MNLLVDTHALAWWLESNPKLSRAAREALAAPETILIIPVMVLVELMYMGAKLGIDEYLAQDLSLLRQARDVRVLPMDERLLTQIDTRLNIHDAIIIASALDYAASTGEAVRVATRDSQITASGLVDCLW